jgi:molybdopterin converting factor small subunit
VRRATTAPRLRPRQSASRSTEFSFKLTTKSARHGSVTFRFTIKGSVKHDCKLAGKKTRALKPGKSQSLTVSLKKGRYKYLSTLASHRRRHEGEVHAKWQQMLGTSEQIRLTVRLFAGLRQLAGAPTLDVVLADPATVADLIDALRPTPLGRLPPRSFIVAINRERATLDWVIRGGDEVALIPPVSGGGDEEVGLDSLLQP